MLYSSDDTHIKNRNATRATPRQVSISPHGSEVVRPYFLQHHVVPFGGAWLLIAVPARG